MAFPGDLLDQANQLIWKERKHPKQVSLRRGISSAYYALFHLLIHDAAANWNQRELRAGLERGFDHQTMKVASNRASDAKASPFHGEDPDVVRRLRAVARTFSDLQRERHSADYDNGRVWLRAQAVDLVKRVGDAFDDWRAIKNEKLAQAYLLPHARTRHIIRKHQLQLQDITLVLIRQRRQWIRHANPRHGRTI